MASSSSPIDKLTPHDPRATHHYFTTSKGHMYHYLQCLPQSSSSTTTTPPTPRATALLLHGFPDFSFTWRHQIPLLTSPPYNLRCIAPDMLGYSYSDSPSHDLAPYTYKSTADDLAELVRSLVSPEKGEKIIVIGHDWGAVLTYRFALYHPELVHCIATVCIPFVPPASGRGKPFRSVKELVQSGRVPNWGYQVQIADGVLERGILSWAREQGVSVEDAVGRFLNAMFGGSASVPLQQQKKKSSSPTEHSRTPTGMTKQFAWSSREGVLFERLAQIQRAPVISESELSYYAANWVRHPSQLSGDGSLRGPMNWYRTDRLNWEDDVKYLSTPREAQGRSRDEPWYEFKAPCLFVHATRDPAVPRGMGREMGRWYGGAGLRVEEVQAAHWVLWESAGEVNRGLGAWVGDVLGVIEGAGGERERERARL